jgi:hypothetical protein
MKSPKILSRVNGHCLLYRFLCTFAATFRRSAFNRMKPVASS